MKKKVTKTKTTCSSSFADDFTRIMIDAYCPVCRRMRVADHDYGCQCSQIVERYDGQVISKKNTKKLLKGLGIKGEYKIELSWTAKAIICFTVGFIIGISIILIYGAIK